jgi:hypothetical protein
LADSNDQPDGMYGCGHRAQRRVRKLDPARQA